MQILKKNNENGVTLIVLILFVKSSKAPSALGNPYKKGER